MNLMPAFPPGPCAETDPDAWFPEVHIVAPEAKALCRSCESRMPCLTWALGNYEHGIWGGTSEDDRDRFRRRVRAGESLEDIVAGDDARYYAGIERALTLRERKLASDRRRAAENRAAVALAAERSGQVAA